MPQFWTVSLATFHDSKYIEEVIRNENHLRNVLDDLKRARIVPTGPWHVLFENFESIFNSNSLHPWIRFHSSTTCHPSGERSFGCAMA